MARLGKRSSRGGAARSIGSNGAPKFLKGARMNRYHVRILDGTERVEDIDADSFNIEGESIVFLVDGEGIAAYPAASTAVKRFVNAANHHARA